MTKNNKIMFMRKHIPIFIVFLSFFLFSCTTTQKITYNTKDIIPVSLSPISIKVEIIEFVDGRIEVPENELLFKNKNREKKIDGVKKCINSEVFYKNKKESFSFQFSKLLATHLEQSKVFNTTLFKDTAQITNYYITGRIVRYYGEQVFSTGALVGAQFGLIGALTTLNITTPAKLIFEVDDLKLYNKDGTLVKYLGNFKKEFNEELHADAYC